MTRTTDLGWHSRDLAQPAVAVWHDHVLDSSCALLIPVPVVLTMPRETKKQKQAVVNALLGSIAPQPDVGPASQEAYHAAAAVTVQVEAVTRRWAAPADAASILCGAGRGKLRAGGGGQLGVLIRAVPAGRGAGRGGLRSTALVGPVVRSANNRGDGDLRDAALVGPVGRGGLQVGPGDRDVPGVNVGAGSGVGGLVGSAGSVADWRGGFRAPVPAAAVEVGRSLDCDGLHIGPIC